MLSSSRHRVSGRAGYFPSSLVRPAPNEASPSSENSETFEGDEDGELVEVNANIDHDNLSQNLGGHETDNIPYSYKRPFAVEPERKHAHQPVPTSQICNIDSSRSSYGRAIADYSGSGIDKLFFAKGDIIQVHKIAEICMQSF